MGVPFTTEISSTTSTAAACQAVINAINLFGLVSEIADTFLTPIKRTVGEGVRRPCYCSLIDNQPRIANASLQTAHQTKRRARWRWNTLLVAVAPGTGSCKQLLIQKSQLTNFTNILAHVRVAAFTLGERTIVPHTRPSCDKLCTYHGNRLPAVTKLELI